MKKTVKRIMCLVLVVLLVASLAGCAKMNYITNGTIKAINEVKSGEWNAPSAEEQAAKNEDAVVIDELTPGTYGGIDFQTTEDVVNYFVEAYDYTKSLTADYIESDGSKATYYKLLCEESLVVSDVLIDGSENSTINSLVDSIVPNMFSAGTWGLSPCCDKNPNDDNNSREQYKNQDLDFRKSLLTADDVLACNVTDNNDGTITIQIQPKAGEMSYKGEDPQGRFFMVLGDIGATVAGISVLSFSQGEAKDNVKVHYKGGQGKFIIDTKTKEITTADYEMIALVDVTHANVTIIKDKSASVKITYTTHFPASDDYLMEKKGIKRA